MIPERGNIHSSRLARRRRRVRLLKLFLLLTLFFGSVGGVAYVLRDARINIARVFVEGNSTVPTEEILALVRQYIEGSYFYFLPKRNILFYPRRSIEASVASAYPRLNSVKIYFRDLTSITLRVEEKHPFALWCGAEYSAEDRGLCYFTDESGFIFAKAPDFYGSSFRRYFVALTEENPVGQRVLEAESFKTLQFFLEALRQEELSVASVSISPAGAAEAYLKGGGRILFNLSQDLSLALQNLKLLLASETFAGKDRKALSLVDYIDLESPNKIFYKPKGVLRVAPVVPVSTSTVVQ